MLNLYLECIKRGSRGCAVDVAKSASFGYASGSDSELTNRHLTLSVAFGAVMKVHFNSKQCIQIIRRVWGLKRNNDIKGLIIIP